jgi:hypothetical protein
MDGSAMWTDATGSAAPSRNPKSRPMTRKENTMLKELLEKMYQDAFMRDKVPQKRKLKDNLHLTLTCHNQSVTFEIARDGAYPSISEWKTCLKYFPYYVGNIEPMQFVGSDGRRALRAELPSRRQVAERMKLDQLR